MRILQINKSKSPGFTYISLITYKSYLKRERTMKRLRLSIALTVFALLALVGGVFAAQTNFRGHLSGGMIVPLQVDSQAQGQAVFKLSEDGQSISYKLNVANVDHVFMAHIHQFTGVGQNGPIIVWLYPSPTPGPGAPTGRVDGTLVQGTFGPDDLVGGFTWDQLLDMLRSGDTYVNVHTTENPGGEINGLLH
jgi:hypothetical protein